VFTASSAYHDPGNLRQVALKEEVGWEILEDEASDGVGWQCFSTYSAVSGSILATPTSKLEC
jgi:hypothetical protein